MSSVDIGPGGNLRSDGDSFWRRALRARELSTLAALIGLIILGSFTAPSFLSGNNFLIVGQQIAQVGIIAIGATFVIISGEIDLSVGSIYALGAITSGLLLMEGIAWPIALVASLIVGLLAGLVNGLLTVYAQIPSFIVTLGTLSVYRGLTLLISDGRPISLPSGDSNLDQFGLLGRGKLFGEVPMQLALFIFVAIFAAIILSKSRFGFNVYAVGGSPEAARLSGIRSGRVKILAFTLAGLLSAFSGVVGLSFLSYVQGVSGTGLELLVIAAVIVGGAALFGGSGSIAGTVVGVAFIGTLQNILNLRAISSFWQILATGAVIILAVTVDSALSRRRGGGVAK